jgi:hypothetical protein
MPLASAFVGPSSTSWQSSNVLLIEPSAAALPWPLVSRGAPNTETSASAWQLSSSDADVAAALYMTTSYDFLASAAFGAPDDTVGGGAPALLRAAHSLHGLPDLTCPACPAHYPPQSLSQAAAQVPETLPVCPAHNVLTALTHRSSAPPRATQRSST